MYAKWPIRVKLLVGVGLLSLLVVVLSGSGLYSIYTYRSLVKHLSWRSVELPLAAKLSRHVADLRIVLSELRGLRANVFPDRNSGDIPLRVWMIRNQFRTGLDEVEENLAKYRDQLESKRLDGSPITDNQNEWQTVHKIEAALAQVHRADSDQDWALDEVKIGLLDAELEHLQTLSAELPSYLRRRLGGVAHGARAQYRTLIFSLWTTTICAGLIFFILVRLFYQWIFRPLRILIDGSRRVAGGEFHHRIRLTSGDEMAELAEAMNDMTARFQAIRDDLDRQVRERTKQVVRSERLAGVGFLAAGVAHEINNPLASIAICAESLERQLAEAERQGPADPLMAKYLRMIQSEAFRCKEITEKLLDFSRVSPARRQNTDLAGLINGVVEMVRHVSKYQQKRIEFAPQQPVIAPVNSQEIKQVVLNLLTNALDCVADDGLVRIHLGRREGFAQLTFEDNGCGISEDVLEHVFEPFFTRRPVGQGTGLGLSITHRIISDHGGEIEAHSPGPGQGATFRVRLPLAQPETHHETNQRAA